MTSLYKCWLSQACHSRASTPRPSASQAGVQEPVAEEDLGVPNPCGLTKAPVVGRYRRHGGLLTGMLGCGIVGAVELVAGHESCRQIYGVLGDIVALRQVDYVIYDNACLLGRFIRNQQRRSRGSIPFQAARLNFVLDRFHARNHRACLDPSHSLFMPEVNINQHPALQNRNTAWNEIWNSWVDNMVPQVRQMSADVLSVFVYIVADLWNERVVTPHRSVQPPHPVGPRHIRPRRHFLGPTPPPA